MSREKVIEFGKKLCKQYMRDGKYNAPMEFALSSITVLDALATQEAETAEIESYCNMINQLFDGYLLAEWWAESEWKTAQSVFNMVESNDIEMLFTLTKRH